LNSISYLDWTLAADKNTLLTELMMLIMLIMLRAFLNTTTQLHTLEMAQNI